MKSLFTALSLILSLVAIADPTDPASSAGIDPMFATPPTDDSLILASKQFGSCDSKWAESRLCEKVIYRGHFKHQTVNRKGKPTTFGGVVTEVFEESGDGHEAIIRTWIIFNGSSNSGLIAELIRVDDAHQQFDTQYAPSHKVNEMSFNLGICDGTRIIHPQCQYGHSNVDYEDNRGYYNERKTTGVIQGTLIPNSFAWVGKSDFGGDQYQDNVELVAMRNFRSGFRNTDLAYSKFKVTNEYNSRISGGGFTLRKVDALYENYAADGVIFSDTIGKKAGWSMSRTSSPGRFDVGGWTHDGEMTKSLSYEGARTHYTYVEVDAPLENGGGSTTEIPRVEQGLRKCTRWEEVQTAANLNTKNEGIPSGINPENFVARNPEGMISLLHQKFPGCMPSN